MGNTNANLEIGENCAKADGRDEENQTIRHLNKCTDTTEQTPPRCYLHTLIISYGLQLKCSAFGPAVERQVTSNVDSEKHTLLTVLQNVVEIYAFI
jgi:hypothetical protein